MCISVSSCPATPGWVQCHEALPLAQGSQMAHKALETRDVAAPGAGHRARAVAEPSAAALPARGQSQVSTAQGERPDLLWDSWAEGRG